MLANPDVPGGFTVTGLVYDTANGLVQTAVLPPRALGDDRHGAAGEIDVEEKVV